MGNVLRNEGKCDTKIRGWVWMKDDAFQNLNILLKKQQRIVVWNKEIVMNWYEIISQCDCEYTKECWEYHVRLIWAMEQTLKNTNKKGKDN